MKTLIAAMLLFPCISMAGTVSPRYLGAIFGNDSPMLAIASCESSYHQYGDSGDVYVNPISDDRGLFQIHEKTWGKLAYELGYDIDNVYGNILMARYILATQGYSAWNASRSCWQNKTAPFEAAS